MKYKVLKGKTRESAILDSTWNSFAKANDRAKTLKSSIVRQKKMSIFVEPLESEDPLNYRKPIKGPFTNYDSNLTPLSVRKGK